MPQKIENKDIFSPDFLEPQKKSFREIIELIKLMESEMKDVLKVQQQLVKTSDKKSVEGLKARQQAIKTVGVASKELMNLEKQRISVEEKSKIASQKVAQQIQKTSQQQLKTKQQKLKLDKEILNAEKALSQAIQQEKKAIQQGLKVQQEELKIKRQKLSIEIQEKKELQRLDNIKQKEIATAKKLASAAAKENSEYFKQSKRLNDLKRKYQDLILVQGKETRESRKLLREVTRLDKKLKKVDASVGNFQRSVGNYGKAFGKVTGVLRNFGLAVGGLAIIRNITGIVRNFEQSQADLASVLGVNVDEMKALTEQSRELGATTRFTAGEVASLQKEYAKLGFDQTEIQAMTEATLQLAAATGTELPRAAEVTGATLRGFGLDASETQRVVDVMAKSFSSSSLDMEKFATAMSSVAPVAKTAGLSVEKTTALLGTLTDRGLDASTAGTGLRNIFLELSKEGMTFEEAMLQINSASDKNAASLALFGKRGATVGTILSETAEDVSNLEAKLNDAGGAAKEMADKQLNTLNGALDLLKSAWEGFILDLEEGTGVFAGLKDVIGFVAKNLKTIIKVIALAGATFLSYKASIIAANIASKAFAVVQGLVALATGKGTTAMKLFNTVVKANPIGLLITVLGAAVTAFSLFSDGAIHGALGQERFNAAVEKGNKLAEEQINLLNTELNKQTEAIEGKLRAQLLENKTLEERTQLIERAAKSIEIANKQEIRAIDEKRQKLLEESSAEGFGFVGDDQERRVEIAGELEKLDENKILLEKNVSEARQKAWKIWFDISKAKNKAKNEENENEEKTNTIIDKQAELLKKLNKLKKDAADATQTIGQQEQEQLKESILLQEIAAEKELQLQLEIAANKPEDVNVDELERLLNERYDLIKRALEDERDLLLLNEDLTAEERELINIQFNNKFAENERNRVKTVDDVNNEIIEAQIETAEKVSEIQTEVVDNEKKYYEQRLAALKQFAAKAIEIANAKTDKEIANVDKELDANKKRQDELQALATQGNLTAEQSIGAEIKREAELERQKEALEKKKARRQIILEGLDLLSSKIDNGDKDAVTSTLSDMTRLLGALSALPGFIDGTETTVGAALGKPQLNTGVDDYIVRVDGSEKILNPNMSARTGNMTTEEITRAAEMYSSGMFDQNVLIHPQINALNQPFQGSNEILKKFDSLESTIRNKPILSDLKFDDLQKALIVTVEQNGDLKRAHYKLK
jgi:myosin heavy subunit